MSAHLNPAAVSWHARAAAADPLSGPREPAVPGWAWIVAAGLAAIDLAIGVWGTFLPRSFYTTFPGGPFRWVSVLGPYDMHLVTDVGESYLMMATVLGIAVWLRSRLVFRVALVTVTVQAFLHALFHLTHLGMFSLVNGLGISISVVGALIAPVVMLVATMQPSQLT